MQRLGIFIGASMERTRGWLGCEGDRVGSRMAPGFFFFIFWATGWLIVHCLHNPYPGWAMGVPWLPCLSLLHHSTCHSALLRVRTDDSPLEDPRWWGTCWASFTRVKSVLSQHLAGSLDELLGWHSSFPRSRQRLHIGSWYLFLLPPQDSNSAVFGNWYKREQTCDASNWILITQPQDTTPFTSLATPFFCCLLPPLATSATRSDLGQKIL